MFLIPFFLLTLTTAFNITLNPLGQGSAYFLSTNLTIGSNHQPINLIGIDTGSATMWVNDKNCRYNKQPCIGSKFDATTSSTSEVTSSRFSIQYDDGTKFKGNYIKDNVYFGNNGVKLEFGLATKAKFPLSDSLYNQALIGLSPACCGDPNTLLDVWFQNLPKVFSLLLPSDIEADGFMLFGQSISNRRLLGSVDTSTVDEDWAITNMTITSFNGTQLTSVSNGILDTGSDLLFLPQKDLDAICKFVGWTSSKTLGCVGDCSTVSNLPSLKIVINGVTLPLNLQDYFTYTIATNQCSLALIASSDYYGWTLGMAVLRQYYTSWDFGNNKVSFFEKSD